jgi:lipoprotein-releasing system permease protein
VKKPLYLEFFQKYLFSSRAGALVKRISWLTVTGLSISIASLVVVISVMTALNHQIESRTLAVEPHLTVEVPGINQASLLEVHPLTNKLKQNPDFKVQIFEIQDIILRTMDGHFRGGVARGLTPDSLNRMLLQMQKLDPLRKGLPIDEELLAPGEILIGVDLAVSLGVFEGDSLMVIPPENLLLPPTEVPKYERVKIKKIISTNLADVDTQNIFYIRDHTLRGLKNAASRQTGIEIWTPDASRADYYKREMEGFPEVRVQTWKERNSVLFLALRLEKIVITLFLSLAALIASFSMISVLILLISQKTKEIGILQAVGLSQKAVRRLFMKIGLCLAGLGLLIGIFVGSSASFYLEKYPLNILPEIYYDSQIPAYLDFKFVFFVFISGAFIAVVGAFLSSKDAARILPTEALRSKR